MEEDDRTYPTDDREWNSDPAWVDYILGLRPVIDALAARYTMDESLREDAAQNATIELLHKFPEEIRGYEQYTAGEITLARWQAVLRTYCLRIAKFQILTTLSSHTQGNLYVGRTQVVTVRDSAGAKHRVRKRSKPRHVSLDALTEQHGLQVSDRGEVSWNRLRDNDAEDA